MASGNSQRSLSYSFRLGKSTVCNIVSETLEAIYSVIKKIVLPEIIFEDWLEIAEGFNKRWNFPNCIGAVDGKHIRIIVCY